MDTLENESIEEGGNVNKKKNGVEQVAETQSPRIAEISFRKRF